VDLVSTANTIAGFHLPTSDRDSVCHVLGLVTRLVRMAHAIEIDCNLRLEALSDADATINPEHVNAAATGRSLRAATRSVALARNALALPHLRALAAAGDISVEHVDAFTTAARSRRRRSARS